jgi:hypothetical protein
VTLLELAERCERAEGAEGADRELDAAIRCGAFAPEGAYIERSEINGAWCVWTGEGPTGRRKIFDRYPSQAVRLGEFTASIDAALTLVPEGWHISLLAQDRYTQRTNVILAKNGDNSGFCVGSENVATPALALAAAALKARTNKETNHG